MKEKAFAEYRKMCDRLDKISTMFDFILEGQGINFSNELCMKVCAKYTEYQDKVQNYYKNNIDKYWNK